MKRSLLLAILGFCFAIPSLAPAHSHAHGQVGVFPDYYRLDATTPNINCVGVGGRASFNVHPNIALEAEIAYDLKRNFASSFSDGLTTRFVNTRVRPLHGLFGPGFQIGSSSPVRLF